MDNRLDWKRALRFGLRTGFVLGALVGFQEGFLSATIQSGGSTRVPLTHIPKLIQVFFTPIFAEAVGWGLICGLLALLLHLAFGRRRLLFLEEKRFVPFFAGLATALIIAVYLFIMFNPTLRLVFLVNPAKLFFNLRLLLAGALLGVATGFLVGFLRARASSHIWKALAVSLVLWILLLTPPLLWVNRVYLEYAFDLRFFAVISAFLVALVGLTWLGTRLLAPRYLRGEARHPLLRQQVKAAFVFLLLATFVPALLEESETGLAVAKSKAGRDMNVLLLSVDTLRADRLGCYQPGHCRTPNFDRLAAEGVLFTNAQAQAPWTLSSLCSLLTSMYPTANGVTGMQNRLDDLRETVAEQIAAGGYMTAAVISNGWLLEPFGTRQGLRSSTGKPTSGSACSAP
jgi:hypothetical protein